MQIRVTSSNVNGLIGAFSTPTPLVLNYFAIRNVRVTAHTSLYADENLLDFYIATFDKIDDPFPIYRKLMLYNGYTINLNNPMNLRFGISNYWSSSTTTASVKGQYFPSMLRLAGNYYY